MPRAIVIIGLIVIASALGFIAVKAVLGQTGSPRVTTVCESKSGILSAFNDGFSVINDCRDNQRIVSLGAEQTPSSGKGFPAVGNIAFMYGNEVLTKEGKRWIYSTYNNANGWILNSWGTHVPQELMLKVVWWQGDWLLDSDGNIWAATWGPGVPPTWNNVGSPGSTQ